MLTNRIFKRKITKTFFFKCLTFKRILSQFQKKKNVLKTDFRQKTIDQNYPLNVLFLSYLAPLPPFLLPPPLL